MEKNSKIELMRMIVFLHLKVCDFAYNIGEEMLLHTELMLECIIMCAVC